MNFIGYETTCIIKFKFYRQYYVNTMLVFVCMYICKICFIEGREED